ncbi:MAG: pyrroline-5-carboxylate reductase [Selenomonadales bacterium]|nr:pyrroline-5-carboxylate reductase [Selenomonadales bacterium]
MFQDKKIGFVGGGAMAEAIIGGILEAGLVEAEQVRVYDVSEARLGLLKEEYGVSGCDMETLTSWANVLFLAVKPQVIGKVLTALEGKVDADTIVISIAAGITIERLQTHLPKVPIVRVMPNTPVFVNAGMAALAIGTYADSAAAALAKAIFDAVGRAIVVPESSMDAVTGLSGSGPAYGFVMIDALSDAGVRVGLGRQDAILLAAQTLYGAAKMVLETGEHPAVLRDRVTSPGGTTIAGVHIMEQQGVRGALIDAVIAATERSKEMGK